ncbi:hypothetical protein Pcinc_010400 [Petrolisthes cinctipes]|uniref:Uncharacterized protein n=1 Tax=Petrolisthes cinctipes TaxID=88211 RepID=A0AAE1G2D0_PETCI|nr:hypothetical protein Pcinc_010615 [Petrolisthes cinctipes]KAK3885368.1 hypothetical protein Pcinc_010400 [Petrolisthes cinctipes]
MIQEDILLHISTDEEGKVKVLYKACPSSSAALGATRVSTTTLVDMAETMLKVPKLNGEGSTGVVRVGNLSSLEVLDTTFPLAREDKHLDIPSLLSRTLGESSSYCGKPRPHGPHGLPVEGQRRDGQSLPTQGTGVEYPLGGDISQAGPGRPPLDHHRCIVTSGLAHLYSDQLGHLFWGSAGVNTPFAS